MKNKSMKEALNVLEKHYGITRNSIRNQYVHPLVRMHLGRITYLKAAQLLIEGINDEQQL